MCIPTQQKQTVGAIVKGKTKEKNISNLAGLARDDPEVESRRFPGTDLTRRQDNGRVM